MHSLDVEVEGYFWGLHHHGDFSGDIIMTAPAGMMSHEVRPGRDGSTYEVIKVPFYVLATLVAEAVRAKRIAEAEDRHDDLISQIEQESVNEILGLAEE